MSCKDFVRLPEPKLKQFLERISPVPIQSIFKNKARGYCFVSVADEDAASAFKAAFADAQFRQSPIVVNDAKPRDASDQGPKPKQDGDEEHPSKRRKKEFKEGYTPTLRDILEKEKALKGARVERSVMQKSAPLVEYPYPTQLAMKETFVKTAIRTFTKQE